MVKPLYRDVRNIFVGRNNELAQLEEFWQSIHDDREHEIFVLLNAPGVGKTVLLKKFGQNIREREEGLFFEFQAAKEFQKPHDFNDDLLATIYSTFEEEYKFIERYIQNHSPDKQDYYKYELKNLRKKIQTVRAAGTIQISDIFTNLSILSRIIPIFIMVDEVQKLQSQYFINKDGEEETYLHYFTRILQSFLKERILIILSGTRYHILNQIGYKIGSPIRGKVKPIIISNLNNEEITLFVEEIGKIVDKSLLLDLKEYKVNEGLQKNILTILKFYKKFLIAFSGGHGRTIEHISLFFLNNLIFLVKNSEKYTNYSEFLKFIQDNVYEEMKEGMLSYEIEEEIKSLSTNANFSLIKKWIIKKAFTGLDLGMIPNFENQSKNHNYSDFKDIVYSLMNIGIIIRNGNRNYYITSYFHLMRFIDIYQEEHFLFLKEITNNQFFKLLCGSHGGFGYTFENIIISAFFIFKPQSPNKHDLPFDTLKLRNLIRFKNKIDWGEYIFQEDVLYSTPYQKLVDLILLQGNNFYLIQITTQNNPSNKFKEFINESKILFKNNIKNNQNQKIVFIFISLYNLEMKSLIKQVSRDKYEFKLLSGNNLEKIIGIKLYLYLKKVKESLY